MVVLAFLVLIVYLFGLPNVVISSGDQIVGYITKGRGVSVHRADCQNVRSMEDFEQRLVEVEWDDSENLVKEYVANIDVYGFNRPGLLNDVMQVLSNSTKI